MMLLKATMLTWKQHWELQSHDFVENGWIGASTNYWEIFCCIISIRERKNWGFVPNMKQEWFIVNVILHAKDIPKICVTFPEDDGGYVIVTFLKHEDVNYMVYNLEFEWVHNECL